MYHTQQSPLTNFKIAQKDSWMLLWLKWNTEVQSFLGDQTLYQFSVYNLCGSTIIIANCSKIVVKNVSIKIYKIAATIFDNEEHCLEQMESWLT